MKYIVRHLTEYHYDVPVSLCYNEARLFAHVLPQQKVYKSELVIRPNVNGYRERLDFFGNRVASFSIEEEHRLLSVDSINWVETEDSIGAIPGWHHVMYSQIAEELHISSLPALLEARAYILPSPLIPFSKELMDYARPSFQTTTRILDGAWDLMQRIHRDFAFKPGYTTIATPLSDVLRFRKGVCQDFAQVMIGGLRVMGIPARYISGYIETFHPSDNPEAARLIGADASHAWVSVFSPDTGWVDFDPTNNKIPIGEHITIAFGRDYGDVAPLKGVIYSSGAHELNVAVSVKRVDSFPDTVS